MGDSYEDVVELGFEGLDKIATKVRGVPKLPKPWHRNNNQNNRGLPPPQSPQQKDSRDKKRARSESISHERDRRMYDDDDARSAYSGPRSSFGGPKNEGDWRDDLSAYERDGRNRDAGRERGYYAPQPGRAPLVRPPAMYNGYPENQYMSAAPQMLVPMVPAPGPPSLADVIRPPPPPDDDWEEERRRRPAPQRRRSSYSPPRRRSTRRQDSPPRRPRSKSPNHHRVAATIVGALAGGFVGHATKKGDTIATVAGAVVGGLGAREAEKMYDRRQDKRLDDEWRRERRMREPEWR